MRTLLSLTLFLATIGLLAREVYIPPTLKPWKEWVLHNHAEKACPLNQKNPSENICVWPSQLSVEANSQGGSFKGSWSVFKEADVQLPGNGAAWPAGVMVNGKRLPVIAKNERPSLRLQPGDYIITGIFLWKQMPLQLKIPADVGILKLQVNGKAVLPNLKAEDLWLKEEGSSHGKNSEDYLALKVFRKLNDLIPMEDETVLSFKVAGTEREVVLEGVFLTNFLPLSYASKLPLQVSRSGELKIQVRPGEWEVRLRSLHLNSVKEVSIPSQRRGLPDKEVWVFQEQHKNRFVQASGVAQVDSKLTDLPEDFRGLPTYLLKTQDKFILRESSRGLSRKDEDSLALERTFWLDFDGQGFTVKDVIQGDVNRQWRLEMQEPYQLGSVRVNDQAQLITRVHKANRSGVEIREGKLVLDAEARLLKKGTRLSAVGWNLDFKRAKGSFNIPPGWGRIALFGADSTTGTWLSKWSLFNLFFVLIISIALLKLRGAFWGAVALIALSLTIHEKGAPFWVWIHLILTYGLLTRLKGPGAFFKFLTVYRVFCLGALLWISFPFIVSQMQETIYPSLEQSQQVPTSFKPLFDFYTPGFNQNMPSNKPLPEDDFVSRGGITKSIEDQTRIQKSFMKVRKMKKAHDKWSQYGPGALIQTGPGIPDWQWNTIHYSWEGPIRADTELKLILLPPFGNRLLKLLRLSSLLMLILCFFGLDKKNIFRPKKWNLSLLLTFGFVITLLNPNRLQAQQQPSLTMLKTLEERLLTQPDCLPDCVAIERMQMSYSLGQMSMRMDLHVQEDVFFQLPGNRGQWFPSLVLLNGQNSPALRSEKGRPILFTPKGVHTLLISGAMPSVNSFNLNFPLNPHHVLLKGEGWEVAGLKKNGQVESNLEFKKSVLEKREKYSSSQLIDFFIVERELDLEDIWKVTTTVKRISSSHYSKTLKLKLLPGETLTSSEVRREGTSVFVQFQKDDQVKSWTSLLKKQEKLTLTAATSEAYFETWRLRPGYTWNINFTGIPLIAEKDRHNKMAPFWKPWPGEKVNLTISRPQAIAGKTITLNKAELNIRPGKRMSDFELTLLFKTSLGTTHTITLPQGVKLNSVSLNGESQSISLNGEKLVLPLGVGQQKVVAKFSSTEGLKTIFKTPDIDLGMDGINLTTNIKLSSNRWVMALGGSSLGPAVLFWGKLLLLIALSLLLGKISWSPLRFSDWTLLSLGLTQGSTLGIGVIMVYLLVIAFRRSKTFTMSNGVYNLSSLVLLAWTLAALVFFFLIIYSGLLDGPRMSIEGNFSSAFNFNWYVDHFQGKLPVSWVISVPKLAFQVLMLLWSLWAAFSLTKWVRWIWEGLYAEGFWKNLSASKEKK